MNRPTPRRRNPKQPAFVTRNRILDILKREGGLDAESLAKRLGFTGMAIRQHLARMEQDGWVAFKEASAGRGRPRRTWHLTGEAGGHFPDRHKEVVVDLLETVEKAFGAEGLERLLDARAREQVPRYRRELSARGSLASRLQRLAELRTEEGYMAEVLPGENGGLLLVENHCPISEAARACDGFCRKELDVFQLALGKNVAITREEHLLQGDRRCAYRVWPLKK